MVVFLVGLLTSCSNGTACHIPGTRYLVWKSPWYPSVRKYKHTFVINVYIQTLLTFTDRSKEVQQSCVVGRTKDREHEMSIENIHDTYQRTTYNIRLRYL